MKLGAIVPLDAAVQPAAAFTVVDGDPVLARVVRALLGDDRVSMSLVVVVAAGPLAAAARPCLDSAGLSEVSVIASDANASRCSCLAAGLDHLGREPHSSSHVLVGDHRYPLTSVEVTDRVIAKLRGGHPAVIPVVALTDTVKAVDDRGSVRGTVDRTALRTVQSPRGYERTMLGKLIADGLADNPDELSAAVSAGVPLATVDGDADAFAAALPAEVELLDAITAARRRSV